MGILSAYLFATDVILYNAFYSVQDITPKLKFVDLHRFCDLVEMNLCPHNTIFMHADASKFEELPGSSVNFTNVGQEVAMTGSKITEDDIDLVNCHFTSREVLDTLKTAGEQFRTFIESEEYYSTR